MQQKPKFICRCSAIGAMMTDPKEKSPYDKWSDALKSLESNKEKYANTNNKETKTAQNLLERIKKQELELVELEKNKGSIHLSKTTIGVINDWMMDKLGYPVVELNNKYVKKGLMTEEEAIQFASKYYGWKGVVKNTERKTNEFITGEADIVLDEGIVDIKSSWSRNSFPLFDDEVPSNNYAWQGLGYMSLWNKNQFQLTYVLMDAPEILIDREANYKRIELGLDEVDAELWEDVKRTMIYSHLPDELRIKSFVFERDNNLIESIYARVEECRKYIEQSNFYELWERTKRS